MELNDTQKAKLEAWARKWEAVEGDYESTVTRGIVHYMCDSGIGTDALSKQDGERLREIFAVDLTTFTLGLLEEVYANYNETGEFGDDSDELECSIAIRELEALADEFVADNLEDLLQAALDIVD